MDDGTTQSALRHCQRPPELDKLMSAAASEMDDKDSEIARLRVALSDAADALDLANSLLKQKPITYALPLTNQFNARHGRPFTRRNTGARARSSPARSLHL